MYIEFLGATREVTGSCFLLQVGSSKFLVECGLIQGSRKHTLHNEAPFPFEARDIDAVILTHAHLDHSGRLPLLVKRGFAGPIYTHLATTDLCRIMFEDAAYLNEKETYWENKKRRRKGLELLKPLFTKEDARKTYNYFQGLDYRQELEILPGVTLTLRDAGHILGSAIIELQLCEGEQKRKVVFSGDLGHRGAPILKDPELIDRADLVVMESTYGDRLHRNWESTWQEMGEIISSAKSEKGNILIPAFTIGRTQEILYAFNDNFHQWNIADWSVFLDSPMGIQATEVYAKHHRLYDRGANNILNEKGALFKLPNLHLSQQTEFSMKINRIVSGAIIIAGSGMCTGGRIKHHLKHNIWRKKAHLIIIGFQARGTLGRAIVDGAKHIRLWGETMQVNACVHTIGGLSAHADQQGLMDWYRHFENHPKVVLVHGEPDAMDVLSNRLGNEYGADVVKAEYRQKLLL